jgi:hypothetical protein
VNNPFDRVIWNPLEKPLSSDWDRALSQDDLATRFLLRELMAKRSETTFPTSFNSTPATGFVGQGFNVVPAATPNLTVTVKAGLGFQDNPADVPTAIGGVLGLDDLSSYKPLVLMGDVVFTVPTPPGANSRVDLIEVRANRLATDPQTRLVLNPLTGAMNPSTVNKTLQFTLDGSSGTVVDPAPSTAAVSYKQGTVAASPVPPATTAGYVAVAYISVGTSVSSIGFSAISDLRPYLRSGGVASVSGRWRLQWNGGAPIVTARRIDAPPGVQITLVPSAAQRAFADIYVAGGLLQGAVFTALISTDNNNAAEQAVGEAIITVGNKNGSNDGGAACGPTVQAAMLTGTPAINVGSLSNFAQFRVSARYQAAGVTNVTQTILEDVDFNVTAVLRW